MGKVTEFLRDNANRYSFHFLAWIVYVFVFLCIGGYSFLCRIIPNGSEIGAAYAWYLIFSYICFYPCIFGLLAFIYARLRLKERKHPDFRIKNQFITQNPFYRMSIVLSVFISIIFCLTLLYFAISGMLGNPYVLFFAITDPFYKITICIVILYLLVFLIK